MTHNRCILPVALLLLIFAVLPSVSLRNAGITVSRRYSHHVSHWPHTSIPNNKGGLSLLRMVDNNGSVGDSSSATTTVSFESPRQLVSEGMKAFREGNVPESIVLFDRADQAAVPSGSLRPFLWQRGISYYYTDDFEKGSRQFRYDVQVNPLDVEERVGHCLSSTTTSRHLATSIHHVSSDGQARSSENHVHCVFSLSRRSQ